MKENKFSNVYSNILPKNSENNLHKYEGDIPLQLIIQRAIIWSELDIKVGYLSR